MRAVETVLLVEVQIPKGKGAILGVVRPTEKYGELLLRNTRQKINNGIASTAAADSIAPKWPVSH